MRDEYDIKNLNPRKNPYVKKQVTINLDESVIIYFKDKAEKTGIPYQILINLYLNERNPEIIWKLYFYRFNNRTGN